MKHANELSAISAAFYKKYSPELRQAIEEVMKAVSASAESSASLGHSGETYEFNLLKYIKGEPHRWKPSHVLAIIYEIAEDNGWMVESATISNKLRYNEITLQLTIKWDTDENSMANKIKGINDGSYKIR